MAEDDNTIFDGNSANIDKKTKCDSGTTQLDSGDTEYGSSENVCSALSLKKGSVILDLYRVESDAFEGGMGSVYHIHHTGWNESLAMKRPHKHLFQSDEQKANFIGECQTWINLGLHPHIVSCYYVREIGGTPSIFAEWIDGGSLKDRICDGRLYIGTKREQHARILDIAIQFERGLYYAHEHRDENGNLMGLIHQDVKPDNLMLTNEGVAKVADFGIAKARAALTDSDDPVDPGLSLYSESGAYTPAYASFEQLNGHKLTRRTDIYSWAVSVLEMFTGPRKWSNGAIAGAACETYFDEAQVEVPQAMRDLLRKCLNADAYKRPHDFAIIEQDLLSIYAAVTGKKYPRPVSKAASDTADSLNNKALSFLDMGMRQQAEKCFDRAVFVDPNNSKALYNRTIYQWHNGRISANDAARLIRMDFENHMGDSQTSVFLAKIWLERGNRFNTNGYLDQAGDTEESRDLRSVMEKADSSYRCDYSLSRIKNYNALVEQLEKYGEKERTIREYMAAGDFKQALDEMKLTAVNKYYQGFVFSPDGLRLSEELGRYGYIMHIIASWPIRIINKSYANHAFFSNDGSKVFCNNKLYSVETGELLIEYDGNDTQADQTPSNKNNCDLSAIAQLLGGHMSRASNNDVYSKFSPDGTYFISCAAGERDLMKIDAATGECLSDFCGHIDNVNSISISADGLFILSCNNDGTARLWRPDGNCVKTLSNADGIVRKAQISYDNRFALIMSNTVTKLWDLSSNSVIRTYDVPNQKDFCVNTQFDKIVFALGDGGLASCSVETGDMIFHVDEKQKKRGHSDQSAHHVCFMPNDQYVIASSGEYLFFWFLEQNTSLSMIPCASDINALAISPDARYIAAATTTGTELWRCYYAYVFSGANWSEKLNPYAAVFIARYPEFTPEQFENIFMREMKDRGFGSIDPQIVLEKLAEMKRKKINKTPPDKPVEPLTLFADGFRIHNGLLYGYSGGQDILEIPAGVIKIGRRVFEGNGYIRKVRLPEGLTEIQENAFSNCAALTIINIPSSLTAIEKGAFSGCKNLLKPDNMQGVHVHEDAF